MSALVGGMVVAGSAPTASAATLGENIAAGSGESRLSPSAAFVLPDRMQRSSGYLYTQNNWVTLLGELKASNFESVIVQYVARRVTGSGERKWGVYFPGTDIYTPVAADTQNRPQVLSWILAAAKHHGMTVTIGLGLDEQGWFAGDWKNPDAMADEADRAIAAADIIWDTYAAEYGDTIDGWYLPHELEGYMLNEHPSVVADYKAAYVDAYLKPVAEHVTTLSGKSRVVVSPLFTESRTAANDEEKRTLWTDLWAYVFSTTAVSVVAPQDGRGSGKNTVPGVTTWIRATVAARDAAGVPGTEVWGNAEVYRDQNSGVNTMPISMLAQNLQAMRAGGASRMITFSAITFDVTTGHHGAHRGDRQAFAAGYRKWATGMGAPESAAFGAPTGVSAVTGAEAGEAEVDGDRAIDTNVTVSWGPAASTSGDADRLPVAFQIRRDGRLIGEVAHNQAAPDAPVVFHDYQQQPGRTLVYTVQGYDGWGVLSPISSQAVVTIPWTSAALESSLDGRGFNVARNAPFTVTNTADQPAASATGLDVPSEEATVTAGTETGKYGDEVLALAPKYTWGNGPLTDGLLGTNSTHDGRWQAMVPTGALHNWVMKLQVAPGASIRQVNTQWRHDPDQGISAPDKVTMKARTTAGAAVTLGTATRKELVGTTATAGSFWYSATAPQTLDDVSEVWLEVTSSGAYQLFAGEIQAQDSTGTNHALAQKYQFFPYSNSAEYDPFETGTRPWTLTDGATASGGSQDLAWAGRNMTTLGLTRLYVTIDLGATTTISDVAYSALQAGPESVGVPASWRIRTAPADGEWTAWTGTKTISSPPAGHNTISAAHKGTARYIQLELTQRSTAQWLFLDEVEVLAPRTSNAAEDRPVSLASNTPALIPAGKTPGCKQNGGCNDVARNQSGRLAGLTSPAPYPLDWNHQTNRRWSSTRHYDYLASPDAAVYGATYEIDLGGEQTIQEITSTWLDDYSASLTLPKQITATYLTPDGQWLPFGNTAHSPNSTQELPQERFTWTYRHLVTTPVAATKIRIHAQNGSLKPWGSTDTTVTTMSTARITAHTPD